MATYMSDHYHCLSYALWRVEASDQPDMSFFKAVLIDWNFVRDNCTHPPTQPYMDKVPDPGVRLQCSFNLACRFDKP